MITAKEKINPIKSASSEVFREKYSHNVYSQNGEDGIIDELLKKLEIDNGWVCEFGAWDGILFSNTFNLVEKNFKAVFIEADNNNYKDLLKTVEKYPNIIPINAFVDYSDTDNSLDNLLGKTKIPINFDVLSIDVDSYDYQIWKSFKKYRPKIVVIEVNSGSHVDFNNLEHIHTPTKYQGTALAPMVNLGLEKGYSFVCHGGNAIFIEDDFLKSRFPFYSNDLSKTLYP
jgi:hypothetical protein